MRSEPIINATRGDQGKKFDTWSFETPKGPNAVVEVSMHHNMDGYVFKAKSDHPALAGLSAENRDVTALRSEMADIVSDAFEHYYEAEWEPALAVSLKFHDRHGSRHKPDGIGTTIVLDVTQIHKAVGKPVGNRGETHVLKNARASVMIQRSHRDTYENDGSLSTENMKFLTMTPDCSVSVVPADPENLDIVRSLDSTMKAFANIMGDRFSFDQVSLRGLPEKEELVEMMQLAVSQGVSAEPEDPDP